MSNPDWALNRFKGNYVWTANQSTDTDRQTWQSCFNHRRGRRRGGGEGEEGGGMRIKGDVDKLSLLRHKLQFFISFLDSKQFLELKTTRPHTPPSLPLFLSPSLLLSVNRRTQIYNIPSHWMTCLISTCTVDFPEGFAPSVSVWIKMRRKIGHRDQTDSESNQQLLKRSKDGGVTLGCSQIDRQHE